MKTELTVAEPAACFRQAALADIDYQVRLKQGNARTAVAGLGESPALE